MLGKLKRYFMGVMMVIIMGASAVITTLTIYQKHPEFKSEPFTWASFFNAQIFRVFEKEYEDKLLIKDTAVGLWGGINYKLFNTGHDKVVIGDHEWLFTEEEFITYPDGIDEEHKKIEIIREVYDFFKSKNIALIIVPIPAKSRIYTDHLGAIQWPKAHHDQYNRFVRALTNQSIPVVNLQDPYRIMRDKGRQIFLRLDTHWTPEGSGIAANIIANKIKDIEYPKTQFTTSKTPNTEYEGDLEKYVPTGMFDGLMPETYIARTTVSNDSAGNDLFSDPIIPVTLVGTSYSAIPKWNFENALKQALSADVLNVSLEGKGPMAPMANYLSSYNFDDTNTRIVIWEIPERFIQKPYDDVIFPDFISRRGTQ